MSDGRMTRHSAVSTLSLILLTASYMTVQTTADHIQDLRQSSLHYHDSQQDYKEIIECLYVGGGIRYENDKAGGMEGCMTDDWIVYELPAGLLDGYSKVNELQSGKTRIQIVGAKKVRTLDILQTDHIEVGMMFDVSILPAALGRTTDNALVKTVGRSNVIAVRVTSRNAEVSLTADEISQGLFGEGVTFASQMHLCSNGALTFEPATGNGIAGAVGEIYIDVDTVGVAPKNLHGILQDEFIKKFGEASQYDHIMYCFPLGTEQADDSWIAYAYNDTPYSYYKDLWCGSLTSKIHEVGHNLGLGHSGESSEYEDRSCIMGVSYIQKDGPQECFNGWRNWSLDWFVDRQVAVDPVAEGPWGGNLAAFVDYTDIANGDYAIIKVRDLYVQYNMAKKYNKDVEEKANQVTVVKSGGPSSELSAMLVGLDMESPSFTYNDQGVSIIIQVCEPGSYGDVDYMRMSVHTIDQASACGVAVPTPTPQPTSQPAPLPTLQPTVRQTPQPTPDLTPLPTPDLTPLPTPDLTPLPTPELTPQPTSLPTFAPLETAPSMQQTSDLTQATFLRRPPIETEFFSGN